MKIAATLRVNGTDYPVELDPHVSLLKAVREELGLTGSKEGCDDSECGACMMLLDGEPVNACSYLALQAVGRQGTTGQGPAGGEEGGPPQPAVLQQAGGRNGVRTPGPVGSPDAAAGSRAARRTRTYGRPARPPRVPHASAMGTARARRGSPRGGKGKGVKAAPPQGPASRVRQAGALARGADRARGPPRPDRDR